MRWLNPYPGLKNVFIKNKLIILSYLSSPERWQKTHQSFCNHLRWKECARNCLCFWLEVVAHFHNSVQSHVSSSSLHLSLQRSHTDSCGQIPNLASWTWDKDNYKFRWLGYDSGVRICSGCVMIYSLSKIMKIREVSTNCYYLGSETLLLLSGNIRLWYRKIFKPELICYCRKCIMTVR